MSTLAPTVSPRDEMYVQRWLKRHGPPRPAATPLLVARLRARRRAELIELAAVTLVAAAFLAPAVWDIATGGYGPDRAGSPLALFVAGYAVLHASGLIALGYVRRADQRLGAALRQRVAHPAAISLRARLGKIFLTGTAVVYGAGLLTALAAVLLATDPADRAIAWLFCAALVLFAALGAAVVADVSRRPAVADDERSLADDSAIRREDAHRAASPFLPLLAFLAAIHSQSGDPLLLVYLGYAALGTVGWVLAFVAARHAPRQDSAPAAAPEAAG